MSLFSAMGLSQIIMACAVGLLLKILVDTPLFVSWLCSYHFRCLEVPHNDDLRINKKRPKKNKTSGRQRESPPSPPGPPGQPGQPGARGPEDPTEIIKIPAGSLNQIKFREVVLESRHLRRIQYHMELEWLLDFALLAGLAFACTQYEYSIFPDMGEFNFGIVWAAIVVIFCFKTLIFLTRLYFTGQTLSERFICGISGFTFFMVGMFFLITEDEVFEFNIGKAFESVSGPNDTLFTDFAQVKSMRLALRRQPDLILLRFVMGLFGAFIAVLFTFPGIRFGYLFTAVRCSPESTQVHRLLCIVNFISPLFILLLWLKPISNAAIDFLPQYEMDAQTFDTFRVYYIIFASLGRLYITPVYYNVFLLSAKGRLVRLKWRGGTTTNKEIKAQITSVQNYINVVLLQYTSPIVLCLFTALMYSTMGDFRWYPDAIKTFFKQEFSHQRNTTSLLPQGQFTTPYPYTSDSIQFEPPPWEPPVETTTEAIVETIRNATKQVIPGMRKVLTPEVFRQVLSFATWWMHFVWFIISALAVAYHNIFTQ